MEESTILKMPDGGRYNAETVPERFPVEPLNAVTNALFLVLIVYWVRKTKLNLPKHPLLTMILPIVLAGTVGGVGHHLFRNDRIWHDIDMLCIFFAVIMTCVFFWYRVTKNWSLSFCFTLFYPLALRAVMFNAAITDRISVFVVFAAMALWIFVPAVIYCWQNKLAHLGYLGASAFIFTMAMVCRQVDVDMQTYFERGSHFLWHILGVLAAHVLMTYVYIIDSEKYVSRQSKRANRE